MRKKHQILIELGERTPTEASAICDAFILAGDGFASYRGRRLSRDAVANTLYKAAYDINESLIRHYGGDAAGMARVQELLDEIFAEPDAD